MFREMRRIRQQAAREECEQILRKAPRGVLAVLGDDDYPYAVPLDFAYEEGHIYFHCAKAGHKLDAVRRHEKVSFCVLNEGEREAGDWWYHFTSVIVFGRIREIEDSAEKDRCLRLIGGKYFPSADYLEDEMRSAPNAVILDLRIDHMTGKKVREK